MEVRHQRINELELIRRIDEQVGVAVPAPQRPGRGHTLQDAHRRRADGDYPAAPSLALPDLLARPGRQLAPFLVHDMLPVVGGLDRLKGAGAEVCILSPRAGEIQAVRQDLVKTVKVKSDRAIADASADEFDAVQLPGV